MKTPSTIKLLKQIAADKERYGVHPCCWKVANGPHSYECRVAYPGPRYAEESAVILSSDDA
jgi:hypothetical protein